MKKFVFTLCLAVASATLFTACDKEKDLDGDRDLGQTAGGVEGEQPGNDDTDGSDAGSSQAAIYGDWELNRIEWTADGESDVEYFGKNESVWTFTADGQLIFADLCDGEVEYEHGTYTLSGNTLTASTEDGENEVYVIQKLTAQYLELRYEDDGETEVFCFTRK